MNETKGWEPLCFIPQKRGDLCLLPLPLPPSSAPLPKSWERNKQKEEGEGGTTNVRSLSCGGGYLLRLLYTNFVGGATAAAEQQPSSRSEAGGADKRGNERRRRGRYTAVDKRVEEVVIIGRSIEMLLSIIVIRVKKFLGND